MDRNTWHVLPINDLQEHKESVSCWCNPRVEHEMNGDVVVHNSLDKREYFEEENEKYIPNCNSMTIY